MKEQDGKIPRAAMEKAFAYYNEHPDKVKNKGYVTVVNFDRPSTEKRMHVIDMKTGAVEDLLVAHAKNSGNNFATEFSNENGSLKSSLGIYLVAEEYQGKHGRSMRLDGMEKTNSNARKRDIVFHGADYVSEETIKKQGRLGKSWGCPAVSMGVINRMVDQLQGGSVLLIYRSANAPVKSEKIESKPGDE